MKRCKSCDAELNDSVKYCIYCGGNEFKNIKATEEPSPVEAEEPITPITADVEETPIMAPGDEIPTVVSAPVPTAMTSAVVQQPVETSKAPKARKNTSGFAKFCSTICGFLLTICLLALSLVLMVKFSLSEETFESIGDNLEGKIADIEIGFLSESIDDDATLSEFLFDNTARIRDEYSRYLNEDISDEVREIIDDVLNAPFQSEFLADTINDYVSYVLYDDGKGYIRTEDILELIEDNSKKIKGLKNSEVLSRFLIIMDEAVRTSGMTEALDLRDIEDENEEVFETIRYVFSGVPEAVLIAASLLMIVLIFVLRRDRYKAFAKIGRAFTNTALFNLLIVAGIVFGGVFLNKKYPLGTEIYEAVLNPIRMWPAIVAAGFMVVGFVFVIIGKIVRRKY